MREPPSDPGSCTLGKLEGLWLELYCLQCTRTVLPAFKRLCKVHGPHRLLCDILPRFKCSHCGARPRIHLQQSATWGASGMGGNRDEGWRVHLR